jgi:polysaccharide biosynthesis transport protein
VWLLVVMTTVVVTLILPESFSSSARIVVGRDFTDGQWLTDPGAARAYDPYFIQTQFEMFSSEVILGKVIEPLDLNVKWGTKYAGGERLKTTEVLTLLRGRLEVRPVRNTSMIEIRVFSERADEAATIANAVAEAYRDHRLEDRRRMWMEHIGALERAHADCYGRIHALRANIDAMADGETDVADTPRLEDANSELSELLQLRRQLFAQITAERISVDMPKYQPAPTPRFENGTCEKSPEAVNHRQCMPCPENPLRSADAYPYENLRPCSR